MSGQLLDVKFTVKEAQQASDEWNFNCGPGSLCAVLDKTPEEIRPYLLDFEKKGYTNPKLMFDILRRLNVKNRLSYRCDVPNPAFPFPVFGLIRIQWAGPWTKANVPMRVRYRHTHWIGAFSENGRMMVFDINAMVVGGWIPWNVWRNELVPWLLKEVEPKASGVWWPTHCIEIERR